MAQIRPYIAQVSPEVGIPSRNASPNDISGPGVEHLGQSIVQTGMHAAQTQGILQEHENRRATTDMYVQLAELGAKHTQRMPDFKAKADPANQDLWGTFNTGNAPEGTTPPPDTLKGDLDALGERVTNATAKERFTIGAANLTNQFLHETIAFQGHMAGVYATQQAVKMTDAWQNRVQTDPSQYRSVLEEAHRALNDPAGVFHQPGMDAGKREQLQRDTTAQITSSMVRGVIAVEPEFAHAKLQAGEWKDLTGEQRQVLTGAAETAIRGKEMEARRAEAELVKKRKEHSDTVDSMLAEQEILSHDPTSNAKPVGWKDLLSASASGMDSDKVKTWMSKIEERTHRLNTGEIKTDIGTKLDLFKRMSLEEGNPRKVTGTDPIDAAYLRRKLSDSDHDWLVKKFHEAKSPDGDKLATDFGGFYKRSEQLITKPGPFGIYADPSKGLWLDKFIADTDMLKQQYIKAGKDPRDLINPMKPEYRGRPEVLKDYTSSAFGAVPTYPQAHPVPGAPPRKSLDDIFGKKP